MFPQTIPDAVRALIPKLAPVVSGGGFYLAGGTAVALHLDHRESVDLVLFSPHEFEPTAWTAQLHRGVGAVHGVRMAPGTLHVLVDGVRVTLLHYPYPLVAPVSLYEGLRVANLQDISLMKVMAIAYRGARTDFIDLFVISTRVWPLMEALRSLPRKFPETYSLIHILRSLQYFEDAEREPMPRMHDPAVTWPVVRSFFEDQVRRFMQKLRTRGELLGT